MYIVHTLAAQIWRYPSVRTEAITPTESNRLSEQAVSIHDYGPFWNCSDPAAASCSKHLHTATWLQRRPSAWSKAAFKNRIVVS